MGEEHRASCTEVFLFAPMPKRDRNDVNRPRIVCKPERMFVRLYLMKEKTLPVEELEHGPHQLCDSNPELVPPPHRQTDRATAGPWPAGEPAGLDVELGPSSNDPSSRFGGDLPQHLGDGEVCKIKETEREAMRW